MSRAASDDCSTTLAAMSRPTTATATGILDDFSVVTNISAATSRASSKADKSDTSKLYADIKAAVEKFNVSRNRKSYVVNWKTVLEHLIQQDKKPFQSFTKDTLKYKFRYLSKLRKDMKKK